MLGINFADELDSCTYTVCSATDVLTYEMLNNAYRALYKNSNRWIEWITNIMNHYLGESICINIMETKFKVGDRVKSIYPHNSDNEGRIGVIVGRSRDSSNWLIDGFCKNSSGSVIEGNYNVFHEQFLLLIESGHEPMKSDYINQIAQDLAKIK